MNLISNLEGLKKCARTKNYAEMTGADTAFQRGQSN